MKDIILEYIKVYKSHAISRLKKEHPDIIRFLEKTYTGVNIKTSISCFLSGKESSMCKQGKYFKSKSMHEVRFCKATCICATASITNKRKIYNSNLTEDEKNKTLEKRKLTMIDRYGVENPAQSKEIYNKIKETCLEKYGHISHLSNNNIRNKIKETCLEKYGVDNPLKLDVIREKAKHTNFKKYGVDNPRLISSTNQKIKETCLEKYGVEHSHQKNWPSETRKIMNSKSKFSAYIKDKSVVDIVKELKISNTTFYLYVAKWNLQNYYSKTVSSFEMKVRDFVESIYKGEILYNSRNIISPKEIDIYIPELKIAIECNGNYWHSEVIGNKDKKYHVSKTDFAELINIHLVHILESEWDSKPDIVKSILRNKLKKTDNVIYGRNTKIREVSNKDANDFLNNNHIQGSVNSPIRIGLYNNNELVSMSTFGPKRKILGSHAVEHEYELYRFCNKINYSIIGSFSKILKEFEKKYCPKKIITYADRRFFNGIVYTTAGFDFMHKSNPNFWYFNIKDPSKLYHRSKFQKYKLLKEGYSKELTGNQIMKLKNYDRIWDCGNLVFEKNYE